MSALWFSARAVSMDRSPRHDLRRPIQTHGTLTVLDGPLAGTRHDIQARDSSISGVSFLLKQLLQVGQFCRIDLHGKVRPCEVIRSRPLSNGKFEMAIAFR